jgi:prepilin signal peptidase PulO-like enzyme (type II secretory pathway)
MSALVCGTWLVAWAAFLSALAVRSERSLCGSGSFIGSFVPAAALGLFANALREPTETLVRGAVIVALAVGAVSDARTGYVFDCITLPAGVAAIAFAALWSDAGRDALGALLLLAPFAVAAANAWIGWGDLKMLFSVALAFGPFESSLALFVAALSGLLYVQIRAGGHERRIAFVPHLTAGAVVALMVAKPVLRVLVGD